MNEEFVNSIGTNNNLSRLSIIQFGIEQIKFFFFFGYGTGGFETLFKLNYLNNTSFYANHVHSDIVEFFGEVGFIGFLIFFISIYKFLINIKIKNTINLVILTYLIIILTFDFSLQIPIIQYLFIIFFY